MVSSGRTRVVDGVPFVGLADVVIGETYLARERLPSRAFELCKNKFPTGFRRLHCSENLSYDDETD